MNAVLLVTDIVESTATAERLGDAVMSELWAAHDRAARALLRSWKGFEINRSDGLLLRFEAVDDAVNFANAYHRVLAGLATPLHARVGIHVGVLSHRSNPEDEAAVGAGADDVAGVAIAVVARLMSIAGAGQTLLSGSAHANLGARSPTIHHHGFWRLRGVQEPIDVFEVTSSDSTRADLADGAKAHAVVRMDDRWVPRREIPHALPAERNAFVGRNHLANDLEKRLEAHHRLTTLLGPGGTGKTRFIQHFAWDHLVDFPGGIWFCDLSAAKTLEGVCSAVAQALGVPLSDVNFVEQVARAIDARGDTLLILDNVEQVATEAGATIGRWLDAAPRARFVATSRSVLGLDGEHVLPVLPLERDEGIDLFHRRALLLHAESDAVHNGSVARLVELLDGLPLAIELAAARTRAFSVDSLIARIGERFRVLGRSVGRPSRQATLRATFDWSWELLSADERHALAAISIFESGFRFDAFEAVLRDSPADALDLLQALIDKSWLRREESERYVMLRSVQDYATERRMALGDDAESRIVLRFVDHYATLDERSATRDRCVELDNLISATRQSIALGDGERASRVLARVWDALKLRGPYATARDLATQTRALPMLALERARVYDVLGHVHKEEGHPKEAEQIFQSGLEEARGVGDTRLAGLFHTALCELATNAGALDEATAHLDEAYKAADAAAEPAFWRVVHNAAGGLAQAQGRTFAAIAAYTQALALAQEDGDARWEAGLLGNLGTIHHLEGRLDDALLHYERALYMTEYIGDLRWEGNTRCNLGLLFADLDRPDDASRELVTALRIAQDLGHRRLAFMTQWNLAIASERVGKFEQSRTHYAGALTIAHEIDDRASAAVLDAALRTLDAHFVNSG